MDDKKVPKSSDDFYCEKCDYFTCRKSQYIRHLTTSKHKKDYIGLQMDDKKVQKSSEFICQCGKQYKHRQGLWKHKKICNINNSNIISDSTLVLELIKQNSEFKELLIEQNKTILELSKNTNTFNNSNIVNGNINNNNFNLQFFLNETCKDAMTIDDFINSLQPTIKDLEETGRLGYSEGITRIIVNGLKELDISKRPIHCSDLRRETMFIKNTETWEKETEEKPLLLKAIKEVGKKNINNIKEWQKSNKNYNHYDSKQNDQYLQIVTNSMSGGSEQEQIANYNKIIKNIAKETIIDKKSNK
jgi:hypothetical protein